MKKITVCIFIFFPLFSFMEIAFGNDFVLPPTIFCKANAEHELIGCSGLPKGKFVIKPMPNTQYETGIYYYKSLRYIIGDGIFVLGYYPHIKNQKYNNPPWIDSLYHIGEPDGFSGPGWKETDENDYECTTEPMYCPIKPPRY